VNPLHSFLKDDDSLPLVAINGPKNYDILGYPVTISDQSSASFASIAADRAIYLFGNPKLIYIGLMNDIRIDSSESYKFNYDQTVFRAIQRFAVATEQGGSLSMLTRGPSS